MAKQAMFALYGHKMKSEQIQLLADFFSLMIPGKPFNETELELYPKKYYDLRDIRPERKFLIMDHKVQLVPSLAEAIVRILWVLGGEIVDVIRPVITLSHPESCELGFLDMPQSLPRNHVNPSPWSIGYSEILDASFSNQKNITTSSIFFAELSSWCVFFCFVWRVVYPLMVMVSDGKETKQRK